MSKATATYDSKADAISVRFAPPDSRHVDSEEVAPGVVLDFDAQGRVIGVELIYVRDLPATAGAPVAEEKATAAE